MAYTTGSTLLFANQGATLGILGELLAFVCPTGSQFTEVIGAGDGIKVTFAKTLTNIGIALGQCGVQYKINGLEYWAWSDEDDNFIGPYVGSGSIVRATGVMTITFSDPVTNLYNVSAIYSTGSVGQDWIILLQQTTRDATYGEAYPGTLLQEVVLRNSGLSGSEDVIVGFREWQTPGSSIWSWNMHIYQSFSPEDVSFGAKLETLESGAYSSGCYTDTPSMYFKDADANTFYFSSNKQRIMGFVRTAGTLDMPFYIGFVNRLATRAEYPQPGLVLGTYNGAVAYSLAGHIFGGYKTTYQGNLAILPNGSYASNNYLSFKMVPVKNTTTVTNYKSNPSGVTSLFPYFFYAGNDDVDLDDKVAQTIIGQLDGIYFAPNNIFISGDTVTSGGATYIVFQDVNRTTYSDYSAMLQDGV